MATNQAIKANVSWAYTFRTQPDSYDDDATGSIDISLESGSDEYAARVKTPYGVIPVWINRLVPLLQAAIQTGQCTLDFGQVHLHIQEHIVNIEPWMRIGWNVDEFKNDPTHSGYMWVETKELHWLLRQLVEYTTD